jgi:hypothetical protein
VDNTYPLIIKRGQTQTQTQNTLFSLGMFTYTYEHQDIIQIALKRLPGGGGVP